MFINNTIYRPVGLEHLGCYELITRYQLKRMSKEKSNIILMEGKKTFNLVESTYPINAWQCLKGSTI